MPRRRAVSALLLFLTGAALTLLIAGFLGATLIRFGPGYETDERVLDARYSDATSNAIARENSKDSNVLVFYGRYLTQAMHGDFGISRSYYVPVSELIRSRAGVTLWLLGEGLALGWILGLALAGAAAYFGWPLLNHSAEAVSAAAMSLPAAVFALLIFLARGPVFLVLAMAVFPRVFRYARDLFEQKGTEPRIEAARARGVAEAVIFVGYVMKPAWPPLLALAGVSFSIAFGALIPVEVVCDLPGIGQLAWKAALGRDLPVLVTLTLLVTAITVVVSGLAEWLGDPQHVPQHVPQQVRMDLAQ